MADDQPKLADNDHWIQAVWKPAMAWLYMAICAFDFIVFPAAMMVFAGITKTTYTAWVPLTLTNGGFIHLTFGAVIGINIWTKRDKDG